MGLGEARHQLRQFLVASGYDAKEAGMRNLASTARLNLVLNQNAAMARSASEWQRMRDPAQMDMFPYVKYHCRKDARTRDNHAQLDGKIFDKNDPYLHTHTPPWEFNCRCWLEELAAYEVEDGKVQPMTPPEQVHVDSTSGFVFDPSDGLATMDMASVNPIDRAEISAAMQEKFQCEVKGTEIKVPAETEKTNVTTLVEQSKPRDPQHRLYMLQKRDAAYQKRLNNWREEFRKAGVKKEIADACISQYTMEAAELGKTPRIISSQDGITYLTPDGKTLVIGDDVKTAEDALKILERMPQKLKRGAQYSRAKLNRVKREASLIGANLILGEHTRSVDLAASNPLFKTGQEKYGNNCQRCVTAYEARRRGIDVEAMPWMGDLDPFQFCFDGNKIKPNGWLSAYKNPKIENVRSWTGRGCMHKVSKKMASYGEGSRAFIRVVWDNPCNDGHVFVAERINGETHYFDPQSNDADVTRYFSYIKPTKTFIVRVDNLKFDANVRAACKPR